MGCIFSYNHRIGLHERHTSLEILLLWILRRRNQHRTNGHTGLSAEGTGKQCQVEIPGSSNPRAGFLLLPGIIDTVR